MTGVVEINAEIRRPRIGDGDGRTPKPGVFAGGTGDAPTVHFPDVLVVDRGSIAVMEIGVVRKGDGGREGVILRSVVLDDFKIDRSDPMNRFDGFEVSGVGSPDAGAKGLAIEPKGGGKNKLDHGA